MIKEKLTDVKVIKSGTDYIVLQIPKSLLKKLPSGYFYLDVTFENLRGGKYEN